MGRWQPGSKARLAAAAFELYAEQGYEATTGAQIAARAGMHERSFFRLFADKREVPFHGMEEMWDRFAASIKSAPEGTSALDLARTAVEEQCEIIQSHPTHARLRHDVIAESAELRERDLFKHAELADALTAALRNRGVEAATARLTAEGCIVALRIAVETWLPDAPRDDLIATFRTMLAVFAASFSGARPTNAAAQH